MTDHFDNLNDRWDAVVAGRHLPARDGDDALLRRLADLGTATAPRERLWARVTAEPIVPTTRLTVVHASQSIRSIDCAPRWLAAAVVLLALLGLGALGRHRLDHGFGTHNNPPSVVALTAPMPASPIAQATPPANAPTLVDSDTTPCNGAQAIATYGGSDAMTILFHALRVTLDPGHTVDLPGWAGPLCVVRGQLAVTGMNWGYDMADGSHRQISSIAVTVAAVEARAVFLVALSDYPPASLTVVHRAGIVVDDLGGILGTDGVPGARIVLLSFATEQLASGDDLSVDATKGGASIAVDGGEASVTGSLWNLFMLGRIDGAPTGDEDWSTVYHYRDNTWRVPEGRTLSFRGAAFTVRASSGDADVTVLSLRPLVDGRGMPVSTCTSPPLSREEFALVEAGQIGSPTATALAARPQFTREDGAWADTTRSAAVNSVIVQLGACARAHDPYRMLGLLSTGYLLALGGLTGGYDDQVDYFDVGPLLDVPDPRVSDVRVQADGRLTAQLLTSDGIALVTFVQQDGRWRIDDWQKVMDVVWATPAATPP